jgi:hypothetical protein
MPKTLMSIGTNEFRGLVSFTAIAGKSLGFSDKSPNLLEKYTKKFKRIVMLP